MPKQIWKIDEFHGGINDNADPRDILNNELAAAENVAVNELGKIRMLGGVANVHTAPTDADLSAGYGLFSFSHDMAGADVTGEIAIAQTNYLALSDVEATDAAASDSTSSVIDLAAAGGAWSDGGTNNQGLTFSYAVNGKPDFYYIDGALRVSDAGFDSSAAPKWYGYVGDNSTGTAANKEMMTTASTSKSIAKKFYDRNAKIEKPSQSTFEPAETQPIHAQSYTAVESEINGLDVTSVASATDTVVHGNISGGGVDEVTRVIIEVEAVVDTDALSLAGAWDYDIKVEELNGDSELEITDNTGQGNLINYHSFEYTSNVTVDQNWVITLKVDAIASDIERIKVNSVEFIKSTGSYADHTGLSTSKHNFHVALKQAGSGVTDAYGWAETWEIGISLIYDGNQESLIRQLVDESSTTVTSFPFSNNDRPPDIAVYCQYSTSWNPRITGAVVYMKRLLDKQWYPQLELDFIRGVGKAVFSDKERPVQYKSLSSADSYIFQFYQEDLLEPQFAQTYESRTGISHDEKAISHLWKTSCISNRRAYIGNLKSSYEDGTIKYAPDTMVRSLPNKFDIFPISESVDVAIHDGEEIIALEAFNDRILQFKERTLYIINAAQDVEFLEDKLQYRGVSHPASVFRTESGVIWANVHGCFFYDGRRVHDLLEKEGRPLIKESTWESFVGTPMVGYSPKTKQIIVVDDISSNEDGDAYIYDMKTRSWVLAVGAFPDTNKSNFIVDWNGDLIYSSHTGTTSLLKKWSDSATATTPKIHTKDIDFGTPSQKKSVKKVYISYKGDGSSVTVLYGKDGVAPASNFYRTGADGSSTNATDSSTPLHSSSVGTDDWVCAELKPVAGSITCNSFRVAIDGSAGTDFEINDISIVYRPKSVK